jgi:Tetracyclin repressor-like, C-terminal domain
VADEIEYSQPVLYHISRIGMRLLRQLQSWVFRKITVALREAASGSTGRRNARKNVATAHLAFALSRPALYEAMFILPTELRFAEARTRPELRAAFKALAPVVTPVCVDVAVVTETLWAAFHGLGELLTADGKLDCAPK